jgi:predicted acetylornithine/succinylornithine family transaminase/N-acetyl-ornithine/N-acetyl-lysine deacetylase
MTTTMTSTMDLENTYTSGVYSKRPVVIVRGSGASLWDAEGHEYIDCMAGHGVANIGHGRVEIADALAEQARRLITCPEIVYNDVRARLLERLARITPNGLEHIFLCNSGTEAIEGAFKFARLATGRTGIVATLRAFHGRSMGALSATWEPHYREPFAPLLPDVSHVRYNDLAAADAAINEGTAAVIIELVQGEGGVHVASEEYVRGLANLCRERGALLIIDEVQTGFGRTGHLFACSHYNVQPDILCLAKSLAGGVPMGAICLGARVIESGRITKGVHGTTFGGNPLSCAVALVTLDIIEREALPERAARLGTYITERLLALNLPIVREVRGRGLLIGIELKKRVQPYLEALCERGVIALPAGPNVLRLLPPLVITEEQIDRVLTVLQEVLSIPAVPSSRVGTEPIPFNDALNTVGTAFMPSSDSSPRVGDTANTTQIDSSPRHATARVVPDSMATQGDESPDAINRVPTVLREVALLQDMLRIPSYSGEEGALARFLVGQAQQMGLHAYVDEVGNFIASSHETLNAQPIVLLGHMDTVRGDIAVRVEDGLLYGRGAVDAKGPLAAFICATARVRTSLQRPVVIVGAVEEEAATSRGARAVVERYQPSACIIGEPSGSEAVTIGYKGRLLVECVATRSSSHSAGPLQSSSEVATAFWERVRRSAEERNQRFAPSSAFAALQPSLRSINTEHDGLEDRTRLMIGYRLPPNYDIAALRTQLAQWADEADIQLSFSGEEAAFQSTRTTPLARAFIAALRARGIQPTFKYKTGTSDMNVVGPRWGQNIVAYGPGDARLDHTPQEHIRIDEYRVGIDVLSAVLQAQESVFREPTQHSQLPLRGQALGSEEEETLV